MARKSRKNIVPAKQPERAVLCVTISTAMYIRLSVEDNKKRGCSAESQRMIIEDYLSDKPEFSVYDVYIDYGLSGRDFKRPAFQRMIADIETGHIACVIVKDLSRLGRNSIDTGFYIEQYFFAHHVRFIAVTDQFDTANNDNLHGGIILPLKNMINEAYSLDIGRKIKAQAHQAMLDGEFIGARAPYGYLKDPNNCHKLMIDDEAAPVVWQIFMWANEHMGLNTIAKKLNDMGIPTPGMYQRGKGLISNDSQTGRGSWTTRTLNQILTRETYTGDMVQGKTRTVDHVQLRNNKDDFIKVSQTHEAIVPREVFDSVQAYRASVKAESKLLETVPFTPNLFKGKVFCADCGRSLHRQRNMRKKKPDCYLFHCLSNSRVKKGACKGVYMPEESLLRSVTEILEKELSVALGMSLPMMQIEARHKKEQDEINAQIAAISQTISRKRVMIRSLYENLVSGAITGEEYSDMKKEYEKEIDTLAQDAENLRGLLAESDERLSAYKTLEESASALAQDHVLTAALIERLTDRIVIDHERHLTISFRFKSDYPAPGGTAE